MKVLIINDGTRALAKAMLCHAIDIQHAGIEMVNCANEMRQFDPCTKGDIFALKAACRDEPNQAQCDIGEHYGAMAPAFYLNKQITTIAPHKKQRRGKFKRSGKR